MCSIDTFSQFLKCLYRGFEQPLLLAGDSGGGEGCSKFIDDFSTLSLKLWVQVRAHVGAMILQSLGTRGTIGDNMDFEKWLKRKGLSTGTAVSYAMSMEYYFREYKWTFADACEWKENEMRRVKPATVNIRIHAINRYAEYTKTRWRLKPIKVQQQQFVESQLTMSQYEKLLGCLLEDGEYRWWAAIKILACTGVRISEFLQIKREDLRVGYVDVCGKGTKFRRIWFGSRLRQEVLSTYKEDGFILPYNQGVIRKRLHAFAKRYGIPKAPLHPHEFRAFYARNVYEKCKDLKFLQDLLGHADIKTTVRYLRKTSKGISRRISKIVTW